MDESLLVWIAAIECGFARDGEWVAWADHHITRLDEPPLWLLHVCVEPTAREALLVLWPAGGSVAQDVWNRFDWIGLKLGFMYLAYERDRTALLDLLLRAGSLADGANFRVDCSAFYELAGEIDGGGPVASSPIPLVDRVAELFKPFVESAQRCWASLQTNVTV